MLWDQRDACHIISLIGHTVRPRWGFFYPARGLFVLLSALAERPRVGVRALQDHERKLFWGIMTPSR